MVLVSRLSKASSILRFALASSGPQNFLGGSWVTRSLQAANDKERRARRLLFLSPHYFCLDQTHLWPPDSVLKAEASRNRDSRKILAREIVAPFAKPSDLVIDYGCGPGFMAAAVSEYVSKVVGCDISSGVLACAEVLNPASNVEYRNANSLPPYVKQRADLVYSFAVAQHLSDATLRQVLRSVVATLKKGGKLLMHVVIDAPGWRTEEEWHANNSLGGRLRRRFGLHCFSRSEAQVRQLVEESGLAIVEISPMVKYTALHDDIARQHLLIAELR